MQTDFYNGTTLICRTRILAGRQPEEVEIRHGGGVLSMAVGRTGRQYAFGLDDGRILLGDPFSGGLTELGGHRNRVLALAFNYDETLLASGSADDSVILWDVAKKQASGQPLVGHRGNVRSVAFSPDGTILAWRSADGGVILWDVGTRRRIGPPLTDHTAPVTSIAFNRTGTLLASGSDDSIVVVWRMASHTGWSLQEARERACRTANRNLSLAEWKQYLPSEAYQRTCAVQPSGANAPDDAPPAALPGDQESGTQ